MSVVRSSEEKRRSHPGDSWNGTLVTNDRQRLGGLVRERVRWLALPYLGLVVLAARATAPYLGSATLEGAAFCPAEPAGGPGLGVPDLAATHLVATGWERAWAPIQLGLLAVLTVSALHYAWPRPRRGSR